MQWRVDVRSVNDFGTPTSSWSILATETRSPAATNTPQRWTVRYKLAAAMRPEIRVVRLDTKNTSSGALHDLSSSYTVPFYACIALELAAAALIMMSGRHSSLRSANPSS